MAVYVSTSVFENGKAVKEAVETLLAKGIDRIELGSIHNYEDHLKETLQQLDAHFITHNFFPATAERIILNLASLDDAIHRQTIDFMKDAIDFAVDIKASVYTVHPGFLSDPVAESQSNQNHDFQFKQVLFDEGRNNRCFERFLQGIKEIAHYASDKDIKIAVETQGSVMRKDVVMLARPDEIDRFLEKCTYQQIGLNLNLGHLNLAANAHGFDRKELISRIKDRIFAVEVTHNGGEQDDHAAVKEGEWYLEVLKDRHFQTIPVIFEGRNVAIEKVVESVNILKAVCG